MSEEKTIFCGSPSVLTRFGSLLLCSLIVVGCGVGAIGFDRRVMYKFHGPNEMDSFVQRYSVSFALGHGSDGGLGEKRE